MTKVYIKQDNSSPRFKTYLRERFLPPESRVLDLYCGEGEMYRKVYKERAKEYLGVDKFKIHDPSLCIKMDNRRFIAIHDLTKYNVFDLDAYGSPWKLFYHTVKRLKEGTYWFFLTDGLLLNASLTSTPYKIFRITERLKKRIKLPLLNRFYFEVIKTMLLYFQKQLNFKILEGYALGSNKAKGTVYLYLKVKKEER